MSGSTGSRSLWGAFTITDRASCEKAIRNGGIAAMISAGFTAVFAGIGFFTRSSDKKLAYLPVVILGIFVFRKSRAAAGDGLALLGRA